MQMLPRRRHDRSLPPVSGSAVAAVQPEIRCPTSPVLWASLAWVGREGAAIWPDRPTECGLRGLAACIPGEGENRVGVLSALFLKKAITIQHSVAVFKKERIDQIQHPRPKLSGMVIIDRKASISLRAKTDAL